MDTFGYLSLPGLLKDKIEEIDEAFETLLLGRGSENHDGQERFCVCPCINHSEYLCTLLDDERITGLAAGLLGESYQYWNSDGNYYSGDTPWHSDTAWPEPIRFYKMAIYLDRMTRDSGALRVIPGSHRHGEGFADHLQDLLKSRDGPWLGLRVTRYRQSHWKPIRGIWWSSIILPNTVPGVVGRNGGCLRWCLPVSIRANQCLISRTWSSSTATPDAKCSVCPMVPS